ncbi:MAG: hypothetical protein R2939_10590 [Kofleriaceae bacterium]
MAALDAMLCEEWEHRNFSFNHRWTPDGRERMASMRTGEGDDWFVVFEPGGVFLKSLWHESPPFDVDTIYAGLPASLARHRTEPAFSMGRVTFGGWHDGAAWTLRGDWSPIEEDFGMIEGAAEAYRDFAGSYFEVDVPLGGIARVLAGEPLDAALLDEIGATRTLDELADSTRSASQPIA